jgi:UDP:flavonoid glycosyltransferase YjiC (YdhE family)
MGFPASPVGYDFTWERVTDAFPDIALAAARGPWYVNECAQEITWENWTPRMADDLLELFSRWQPDLIVREGAEYGASLAGKVAKIPVACAAWGALVQDTVWARHLPMDILWRGYARECERLDVSSDVQAALRGELVLSTLPPSWMEAGDAGLGQVRYFRAPPQDQGIGSALSGDLVDLITERFVYATLGTVFNTRHRLREAILAALEGVPAKVLFTTGRGVDLHRVEIPGRNITLKSFVPQSLVVPHAALIVSHAGLGTIIGALYAGVPMVLISIGVDHPVNAERAVALGVAKVIDAAECEPERLRTTILLALADEELRKRAREIRDECRSLPEISESATVLQAYASA